jgi:DNA polymerase-3 subunit delta'
MTFSSLIGNASVKAFLTSVLMQPASSQVFLFTGPSGVGKRSFAMAFAKGMLGKKHEKKIESGNHPDLFCFRPEGKTHMHPISSIRKILEEASLPPFEASLKVFLIEEADRMLPASSNALLKTLEEPSSCCRFILLTSKPDEILPTIASRCCKVPFYPIAERELGEYLEREKGVDPAKISEALLLSQGSLEKALESIQSIEDPIRMCFMDLVKNSLLVPASWSFLEVLTKLEKLLDKKIGNEEESKAVLHIMDPLFELLLFWIRDLHLLKESIPIDPFHQLHVKDLQKQLLQGVIPSLERTLHCIEEARFALQRNSKPKAVLEHLFRKISAT